MKTNEQFKKGQEIFYITSNSDLGLFLVMRAKYVGRILTNFLDGNIIEIDGGMVHADLSSLFSDEVEAFRSAQKLNRGFGMRLESLREVVYARLEVVEKQKINPEYVREQIKGVKQRIYSLEDWAKTRIIKKYKPKGGLLNA